MSNATNYALRPNLDWATAWSEVWRDLLAGAFVITRFVAVLAGCVTLLAAGTLVASGDARGRLVERSIAAMSGLSADLMQAVRAVAASNQAQVPRTVELVPADASVADEPQRRHVTEYLARRYRVADEAVRLIVGAAYESGRTLGLDPLLILAVTAIESSMNPYAESPVGAQGLMQVMTRVHTDKFVAHGGELAALDPVANLAVGSTILKDLVRRGGSIERGLQLYVGAGNLPDDGGYAARVMAERDRLSLAATGRVERAVASARAAAAAESRRASDPPTMPSAGGARSIRIFAPLSGAGADTVEDRS